MILGESNYFRMTAKDGLVNLWDLPEDKVVVKFSCTTQKQMVEKAKEIDSLENISKELGIGEATFYDFQRLMSSTTLKFVKKLSAFLTVHGFQKFSMRNLQKEIELIKTKYNSKGIENPKFPINFNSSEGAQIVSGILFDGGITEESYNVFYVNNEKFLIDKMVNNVKTVVGNTHYNTSVIKNVTHFVNFPQIIGFVIVHGLGVPNGRKVFTNPSIPDFISNGSTEIHKAFLQQAFDDEGSIKKSGCRQLQFTQHLSRKEPPIRLAQIKKMLENFGIIVSGPYFSEERKTKRGYISYGWKISITNQNNLIKFMDTINFSMERKKRTLEARIKSYSASPYPPYHIRNTVPKEFFKACTELVHEGKKITVKNVSEKAKRSLRYTRRILVKLLKEGKLRIAKEHRWNGFGSEPAEFETIDIKTHRIVRKGSRP